MNYEDYLNAGLPIFGLYGVKNGQCECGNPDCEAFFKHPRVSNWQHTPLWSDEQLENLEEAGHLETGYGVLVRGLLIVDVDARNGGVDSYQKLCASIPQLLDSAFIVRTGSGGGSKHVYFKMPEPLPLMQTHREYPGIDFKTSGFVVGAGSIHASGDLYEVEKGSPNMITNAPTQLVELLKKPERHRGVVDGLDVDISDSELRELLSYINPDCDHETWLRVGMALHHTTGGSGFDLWDDWSSSGEKYPSSNVLDKRWQSFGKSSNPVTLGTLMHYAKEGGYIESVEFVPTASFEDDGTEPVDLQRPPGFVGRLTDWINSQCLYPRESLAVAAALSAVSNVAGMRYRDALDGITPNIIAFCVSGSGTGKEQIAKSFSEIMRICGLTKAMYGAFKSEQELYRNLLRHQAAFYSVDELGIQLTKISNAMKRGSASYLEGLLGSVMSVYSKADSFLPITGDLKEEVRQVLAKEYAALKKQADEGRTNIERRLTSVEKQLENIDQGIDSPYLGIIGYTTPVTFDALFDYEQATNGFMSRALIFRENETNPKRRSNIKRLPMPFDMQTTLQNLYNLGSYEIGEENERIEFSGEKVDIPTSDDGRVALDHAYQDFWDMAEQHKNSTGLEAIPRRGYEMAAKISLILAIPEGLRTAEHVHWGVALAKRDIDQKLTLAYGNTAKDENDKLAARIMSVLDDEEFNAIGFIKNRCRSFDGKAVEAAVIKMTESNILEKKDFEHPTKKTNTTKYRKK